MHATVAIPNSGATPEEAVIIDMGQHPQVMWKITKHGMYVQRGFDDDATYFLVKETGEEEEISSSKYEQAIVGWAPYVSQVLGPNTIEIIKNGVQKVLRISFFFNECRAGPKGIHVRTGDRFSLILVE